MRCKVHDGRALYKALRSMARAVNRGWPEPLRAVLLEPKDTSLCVRMATGDITVWASFKADVACAAPVGCDLEELRDALRGATGRVVLDAEKFGPEEAGKPILVYRPDDKAEARVGSIHADELPAPEMLVGIPGDGFEAATWACAYDACESFTARDSSRGWLQHIAITDGCMWASDGKRLAEYKLRTGPHECAGHWVVQKAAARIVAELAHGYVIMNHDVESITTQWTDDGLVVRAKDVEGTMPNYRDLIPSEHPVKVELHAPSALKMLKQLSGRLCDEKSVIVDVDRRSMTVSTETAKVTIPIMYGPEETYRVHYSALFLADALRAGGRGLVTIGMDTEIANVLRCNGFRAAWMPCMVREPQPEAEEK